MESAQAIRPVSVHENKASALVTSDVAEERTSHEDEHYLSAGEEDEERSDTLHEDKASPITTKMSLQDHKKPADAASSSAPEAVASAFASEAKATASHAGVPSEVKSSEASAKEDDHKELSSSESKASPAEAIITSEDQNKSDSTAKESSSSSSKTESHSDQPEKPPPAPSRALSLSMNVDSSTLMVSEKRDVPGGGGGISTFAKSKSMSVSDARVAKAFVEEGGDEKGGMKIVARPTADDDFVSANHHRRCVSVDIVAKIPNNYSPSPSPNSSDASPLRPGKVQIDTAAPIKSVKAAVSKFGGIVDWKAHRVHTVERRKLIEQELEKAQEELPACKRRSEAADEARKQVLKQLESTKRLIEELKLNLERAQTEEQQAKQDSDLAKLRVEEMEQGIADEASVAAKAQLEVAKARHAAAVSELQSVKDELEQLRPDYDVLIAEKEAAEKKAEEAMFSSKEVEKSVESLTIELITLKQSLDSAHSAHLEAEEHRLGAVMAKEQDNLNWEVELKQAEEELEKLNQQVITTNELKSKLSEATALLQDLKRELAAYMESKPDEEETSNDPLKEPRTQTRADIEKAISAAKKELAEVKNKIEKATKEVNILKVASASLKSQLEKENMELESIQKREGEASTAAESLEGELNRIKYEIEMMQMKEQEEREKLVELPLQIQKAGEEVEQAKELVRLAGEDLEKAREEADEAKAGVSERESKLRAVEREIEVARAAEGLALAAINALKESENAQRNKKDDKSFGITLSLEEYYELSKRAHEAEEQANARVAAAMSQIETAKEAEKKNKDQLEEVNNEMSQRKNALKAALQKAADAAERKTIAEQELKKWRADHEHKRHFGRLWKDDGKEGKNQRSPKSGKGAADDGKGGKKKKKSFIPKIFMFLGKNKKTHSSKPEGS